MTVKDLIERLKQLPNQDATVELEGCDCTGAWNGEVDVDEKAILLRRDLC